MSYVASVAYTMKLSPKKYSGTWFSLSNALQFLIGSGLGILLTGQLVDNGVTFPQVFIGAFVIGTVACAISLLAYKLLAGESERAMIKNRLAETEGELEEDMSKSMYRRGSLLFPLVDVRRSSWTQQNAETSTL